MKYLLKIFILLTLLICVKQLDAQVTGVQYAIIYNSNTNLFDCFLFILDGEASTVQQRVQFNTQYSVIVPNGAKVNVERTIMPLVDNQKFEGTQPIAWAISSKLTSPSISPDIDIYGITPNLAPTGFYDKLSKGDLIKLFSLKFKAENIDLNKARIFNNDNDPKSYELGMGNGDFSNGFTIGGYHQIYKGIKNMNQDKANLLVREDRNK
jgi:hypothetical protein